MSFTIPVGNFIPPVTNRPSSVVDTVNGGVITSSNLAFDADPSTFGIWQPAAGFTNRSSSVFTFSGSTVLNFKFLLIDQNHDVLSNSYGIYQDAIFEMSVDSGATYPYSVTLDPITYPTGRKNVSISVPFGTVQSTIRLKYTTTVGNGATYDYIYNIYIQ